jgi:hypothetical protein
LLNIKYVFLFSLQPLYEAFLILKRFQRDTIINAHVKYALFLSNFVELELSQQIFEKTPNIKFHENPTSGSQVDPCGHTDGWADGRT